MPRGATPAYPRRGSGSKFVVQEGSDPKWRYSVWEAGKKLAEFPEAWVAFSNQDKYVFVHQTDWSAVRMLRANDLGEVARFESAKVSTSPSDRLLMVHYPAKGEALIRDLESGQTVTVLPVPGAKNVGLVTERLAVATTDTSVRLVELPTGRVLGTYEGYSSALGAPDGSVVSLKPVAANAPYAAVRPERPGEIFNDQAYGGRVAQAGERRLDNPGWPVSCNPGCRRPRSRIPKDVRYEAQ